MLFLDLFANKLVVEDVFLQFFTTKIPTDLRYSLHILDYQKKKMLI